MPVAKSGPMRRVGQVLAVMIIGMCVQPDALADMQRHAVTPQSAVISFSTTYLSFFETQGGFHAFSGWFEADPDAPEDTKAELVIDAASLFCDEADWQEDLEGPDFFDVRRFPEIRFVARKVTRTREGRGTMTGDLTIRGITREVTFQLEYDLAELADGHKQIRRIDARTTIDRTQFGMTAWDMVLSDAVDIAMVIEP